MVDLGPRRLSKPRTNKSSVNIVTASEQPVETPSPHSSSDRDYFGEHAVIVTSQGERRSRSKSRSRIRAYLYTSNRGSVQDSSDEGDGQNSLAGAARDVRKRLSRTSSSIVQSARASTTLLPHLDSHCSDPEETAMMADQIKERAYRDSLAAQNHVSSPVDEQKHVDSVMAPLRRKSLYTPGLATRDTGDILRKPPSSPSQADRENYFNPASPQTSPLSQLAASNPGDDGRSTPSNIHYPQLGYVDLGIISYQFTPHAESRDVFEQQCAHCLS